MRGCVDVYCSVCDDFVYQAEEGCSETTICPACQVDSTGRSMIYVQSGGLECPYCHDDNISGVQFNVNAGRAEQEMTCGSCHKGWTAVYELTGIEEISE